MHDQRHVRQRILLVGLLRVSQQQLRRRRDMLSVPCAAGDVCCAESDGLQHDPSNAAEPGGECVVRGCRSVGHAKHNHVHGQRSVECGADGMCCNCNHDNQNNNDKNNNNEDDNNKNYNIKNDD